MFTGFSKATVDFLSNLKENNNKQWFEANRENYEKYLFEPFQELVTDLGPFMLTIDPCFETSPKKCISRIYRDVRFSRDKSPYRANMWLTFDWKAEPVYFFEVFPNFYRYGMGFYEMPKESMEKLRELILKRDKGFEKIDRAYRKQDIFVLEGQKYKRTLNDTITDEQKDWYQRKEIYFVSNRNIDGKLFSRELTDDLMTGFSILKPAYEFFLKLRDNRPVGT